MKRDLLELLLGVGVLALGLGLLLFTFSQALALAQNPGTFFESQIGGDEARAPTAAFDWGGSNRTISFTDTSQAGDVALVTRSWDFGDGNRSTGQNPMHAYAADGVYQASLVVEDANGKRSTAVAQVDVVQGASRSGRSLGDPTANLSFNVSGILLPFAIAFLTFGLHIVMALAGGMTTKAGWNLVKPKPETIRVRMKPGHLTGAFEPDPVASAALPIQPPPPKV